MPEVQFPINPGVFKDETPLKSEGWVIDTQNMRIHRDGWQTQRGYETATADTFTGLVRGSAAWADLSGIKTAGFGTAANLYAFYGGEIRTVTPEKLRGSGTDIFTTVSGSPIITVTITAHGLQAEDVFEQMNADAVGGITLDASYTITEILDLNRFTITHGSNASSSATGGGKVDYWVAFRSGLVDGTGSLGYGTGTYSGGVYGQSQILAAVEARRWSISPWGQNMLANVPGGPIYEYQPRTSYPDLLDGVTPTLGTGWTGTTTFTATAGTGSSLEWDLTGIWSGGDVVEMEIIATVSAGSFQVKQTSATGPTTFDVGLSIDEAGTYTRNFQVAPSPTTFSIAKDATFAGTVQVSLKVKDTAYRIGNAPPYADGVVVDANNVAICWATVRLDGVYDRRCLRTSDQGDNKTWNPTTDNLASENTDFGVGSQIIGVIVTRAENLVFTDAGVYSMQFTGEIGNPYTYTLVGGGAGLKAPGAVAQYGGRVFWLGNDDNFYIYQGTSAQVIECPLRRDMIDNLAVGQDAKIDASVQARFSEIRWIYADKRDGNEVSRAVVFNWVQNAWYNDIELRTDRIGTSVFGDWIGFGQDGNIYYHELGTSANGNTLTAKLQTGFYDADQGHNWVLLLRFMPDFDDFSGSISLTVTYRDRATGTEYTDPDSPHTITPTTTAVPLRIMARQFSLTFEGSATDLNYRLGSFRMDMEPTGVRH